MGATAADWVTARIRWLRQRPGWPGRRWLTDEHGGETTRTSARTGGARARAGMSRRASRVLVCAAIAATVLALALIFLGGSRRDYHLIMQNAGQLVPGDLVRIGGIQAGSVKALELTPDGQADVTIALGNDWGRLHAGTTVTVRASGIATITGRYVDISPGPSFRPALADGGAIDVDHTTSIVDIDQLLNAVGPAARRSLRKTIHGLSVWYDGRTAEANASAHYFPATLQAATRLFDELGSDSGTLEQFI